MASLGGTTLRVDKPAPHCRSHAPSHPTKCCQDPRLLLEIQDTRSAYERVLNTMERHEQILSGSGIPIAQVYTPESVNDTLYEKDIGLPGQPPFTRGVYPTMYRGRLWTIRRYSGVNTPEDPNNLYRREYELGQTGFSVAFDVPTGFGLDSDDPRAVADVGDAGVPVSSLEDMEITFEGLPLDKVGTALEASTMAGCPLTAMYLAVAEKRGYDIKQLRGTTLNDLCASATCAGNAHQIPPRELLRLSADFIEWCCQFAPKWHPMCLDSYPYREQGISAIQEGGLDAICTNLSPLR